MSGGRVKVEGLRELRKALRDMESDGTWKSELRQAGLAAAEIVADQARQNARRGFTTKKGNHATMGSRAIASIRAGAGQARATVTGGRASIPYFGGANFGGGARQFGQRAKPDYALYAALQDKRPEVIETYTAKIDELTGKHFK